MTCAKATAAASIFALLAASPALAADINHGDPTATNYVAPISWSGFYVGGHIGYGIASQKVTTLSTEHFDAVPSRCWFEKSVAASGTEDHGTEDTSDDNDILISNVFHFSVTNVTAEDCGEVGSETDTYHDGAVVKTTTKAFDPAVDAHSATTRTVGEGSDSGIVGGLQVGYDHQFGRFVTGIFADYNWSDIADKNNDWTIGGRVGFLVDPRLMVYGLAGYSQADYDHADYEGWTFGAGTEYALDRNVFVGTSYRYTDLDTETLVSTPDLNVKSDIDEHKILVDLKLKLNGGLGF